MVWNSQICRTHPYPTLLKFPHLSGLYRTIKPNLLHCSGNFPSPRWINYRRKRCIRQETLTPTQKHMTQWYYKTQGNHTDQEMELRWSTLNGQQYGTSLIHGFGSIWNSNNNPRTKGGTYGIRWNWQPTNWYSSDTWQKTQKYQDGSWG